MNMQQGKNKKTRKKLGDRNHLLKTRIYNE